jgi:hypothetical protein
VIADQDDASRRGRTALGLAGRLLIGALLVEACWCAVRSDLVGLVITVAATMAVIAAVPPR